MVAQRVQTWPNRRMQQVLQAAKNEAAGLFDWSMFAFSSLSILM